MTRSNKVAEARNAGVITAYFLDTLDAVTPVFTDLFRKIHECKYIILITV